MPVFQGLISRNPSLTPEEFSASWYTEHAAIAVPFFLSCGVTYYAQVHGPLTTSSSEIQGKLSDYDGAAEMNSVDVEKLSALNTPDTQWKMDYYTEVIMKDEERLLKSQALQHILEVPEGAVKGERRVVIENGVCGIEIPEKVWEVWREYEKRGRGERSEK